jgi:hypothetical protein
MFRNGNQPNLPVLFMVKNLNCSSFVVQYCKPRATYINFVVFSTTYSGPVQEGNTCKTVGFIGIERDGVSGGKPAMWLPFWQSYLPKIYLGNSVIRLKL